MQVKLLSEDSTYMKGNVSIVVYVAIHGLVEVIKDAVAES